MPYVDVVPAWLQEIRAEEIPVATKRTWQNQFHDYPVPGEIDQLAHEGILEDTSWGNDVCPSFEMHLEDRGIRIWVDHPEAECREMKTPERFLISPLVWDEAESAWIMPESSPPLLKTDSITEVLSYIAQFGQQSPQRSSK